MRQAFPCRVPMIRQGGWVGLVVLLVAIAIVALLAQKALKQYGLVPGAAAPVKAASPGERARAPAAVGAEAPDLAATPPAPAAALERARGVEETVKQQAAERAARGDGTTR